ncbi:hypothetical protein BD769DRAFT_1484728 [Suillus cothurnatus]|nr:hypothetical protein BD769DRAFT_1484728 [Suillus cothurnatus]
MTAPHSDHTGRKLVYAIIARLLGVTFCLTIPDSPSPRTHPRRLGGILRTSGSLSKQSIDMRFKSHSFPWIVHSLLE